MDLWRRLAAYMLLLIDRYDDQAIFLWVFIEETGIPLPLPGDLAILLAGYRASQGTMDPLRTLLLPPCWAGRSCTGWARAAGGPCCSGTAATSASTTPGWTASRGGCGVASSSRS